MPLRDNAQAPRFPSDLATVLAIPGAVIFTAVTFAPPRWARVVLFGLLGLISLAVALRLLNQSRYVSYVYAVIYIVLGVVAFYVAYVAILFV
jgi:uncharacterized membrane protein